jgi:hypothetical protein
LFFCFFTSFVCPPANDGRVILRSFKTLYANTKNRRKPYESPAALFFFFTPRFSFSFIFGIFYLFIPQKWFILCFSPGWSVLLHECGATPESACSKQ